MRISTNTIYEQGVSSLQKQQYELVKTQQQVASGHRIMTPADDPIAAARVLELKQADGTNTQFGANRTSARSALNLEEGVLTSVTSLLQDVRTAAVTAGNGMYNDGDRAALATELQGRLEELVGLANSRDATGAYLFSGYQGAVQPFSGTGADVAYSGDQGQRLMQVGPARQLAVSDPGSALFQLVPNATTVYLADANPANTSTAVLQPGTVTTPGQTTGHVYQVQFTGLTTYNLVDTTDPTQTVNNLTYTPGTPIDAGGVAYTVQGVPQVGDRFTMPRTTSSVFETIGNLISALRTPTGGTGTTARYTQTIQITLDNIDEALHRVLTVRADIGVRLQELDSLDAMGEDLSLQYQKNISQLQDVDYAASLSTLTRQQTLLQAAQQTFVKITGMSLFDYLS